MSRQSQRGQRQLPPKKPTESSLEDGAILGEYVDNQLVTSQTIDKFADRDRDHEDFERFLGSVNKFQRERNEITREHIEKHPDAIESRKTQNFRRHQYWFLIAVVPFLLATIAYMPLAVGAIFGIIVILIVSGVLVNGRDREMDLNGFIKMIISITGRKDK